MVSNLPQREEYFRKKRRRKFLKIGLVILFIIFIIGLASYISHRLEIRISKVELSGGILVTQPEVESKSLSYISGSYFWLFPKNNALLYPTKGLLNYLSLTFKRIDTVNIHRKDWRTIVVEITERKPIATWCDTLPNATSTPMMEDGVGVERCYFLDQNGTIFAPAPYFSGDAYFKYYGLVRADTPIGMQYLASTTEFSEITDFIEAIKKLSIKPEYLIAKGQDEFSLVTSGGGQIYFDTKIPLSVVAENLQALLRTPELSPSSTQDLPVEYIDMRFGNKLFYKLK